LEGYYGPLIYTIVLEVLLACGDYELALESARIYRKRMVANQVYLCMPDILHDEGRALLGLGRREEAYPLLLEAYQEARMQTSRRNLVPILADLSELEPDSDKAAAYRQEGEQVVAFIAEAISEPRLKAAFLDSPAVRSLNDQAPARYIT
jgi:hypothetical protein